MEEGETLGIVIPVQNSTRVMISYADRVDARCSSGNSVGDGPRSKDGQHRFELGRDGIRREKLGGTVVW